MQADAAANNSNDPVVRYQAWWGLAGCGLIIGLIWLLGPYSEFALQPRRFTFDYPWKLPDPTAWTRFTAWSLYALHQVGAWYLIYKAQSMKLRYVKGLHRVNLQMLGLNRCSSLCTSHRRGIPMTASRRTCTKASALASVALMLFVILIMENDRRGLFFGKRVPFPKGIGESARKYHGYYFSWAITYTFWYHPIEITPGHLMGLFYMMMLFLQGSLFMTRYHVNRWWTVFLEFFAVIHGTTVAWFAIPAERHAVVELPVRRPGRFPDHADARREFPPLAEIRDYRGLPGRCRLVLRAARGHADQYPPRAAVALRRHFCAGGPDLADHAAVHLER